MKTAYSTYSTHLLKTFKSVYPKQTEEEYLKFAIKTLEFYSIQSGGFDCISDEERSKIHSINSSQFLWKYRKIKHFFLAPGVADFCVSNVKSFSSEYCKPLPVCENVDKPRSSENISGILPFCYSFNGMGGKIQGGFAIHFPSKERQRSVMVIPNAMIPLSEKACFTYYFTAGEGISTCAMNPDVEFDCNNDDNVWIPKLVFGLSLYMDAFPDAVVEATSDNVHNVKYYEGDGHVVARNEIIDEDKRNSVSPHWRRGFFRLLTSKHFVKKQGQTIYVRGTFVKGKAFDVLDDTPDSTIKPKK